MDLANLSPPAPAASPHLTTAPVHGGEIYSLTSIRGIAALAVTLKHANGITLAAFPNWHWTDPLYGCFHLAVPLFFVLSGYVLSLRYLETLRDLPGKKLLRFWWLRLGRVYPLHFVTLLILLVMVAGRSLKFPTDPGHSPGKFVANLFLVQAWTRDAATNWNYPSWSLSSEWFAYLWFPLLAALLSRRGRTSLWFFVAVTCGLSAWLYSLDYRIPFYTLVVVIPTFAGGAALAILFPPSAATPRLRGLDVALLALLAISPFTIASTAVCHALWLVIFFVLVAYLGSCSNAGAKFWRWRPLVFLGDISYSLYMIHAISITLLTRFSPIDPQSIVSPVARAAFLLLGLALTVLSAAVMYYLIEMPCRSMSRRMFAGPPRQLHASQSG